MPGILWKFFMNKIQIQTLIEHENKKTTNERKIMTTSWILAMGVYAMLGWMFITAEDQRKFDNRMIESGIKNKHEITINDNR